MDEEKKNGLDHQDDSSEINLENKQDLGETSEKTLEQNDSKIKNNVIKNIISTKFFIISSASLTAIILIVVLAVSGLFVHTHNFGEWKEIVSSKCETVGKSERVCECGEVETQRIPPMGHTPGEWVTDSTATCTTNGSKHQECLVCNETVNTQILSAFGHSEGNWVIDSNSTCTTNGSKHQVCSICNETINTQIIPKVGHTEGKWITDKNAFCTTDGIAHQICSVCNETLQTLTLPAFGHTEGNWVVDSNSTCATNGSKHQVCSVCDATIKTETLKALGHTDGEWVTDSNATCTTNGSKHQVCSVCDATINTEEIRSLGHNYNADEITKATETTNLRILFVCERCQSSHSQEYGSIVVSSQLTGSGIIISGGTYYTRSFEVTASGGYGNYMYKFESGSNLLRDYSSNNEITVQGNALIDIATITITVMDEAGQKTVYKIKGDGRYVESYVVYD